MGLPQPAEMTGMSLLRREASSKARRGQDVRRAGHRIFRYREIPA